MGFIKAAITSASSTLRDTWKEYFTADALDTTTLAVKAHKNARGFFNGGSDNIITDGSGVVVANGQCAIIVENGVVVDILAEPGEYTYDNSVSPSILTGNLSSTIKATLAEMGRRFQYGGQASADQRVYYFNTKEITGNKFGTPNPIPFRVVDERAGIDIDISVKCFGEYSFRITDPVAFYTNNAGNFQDEYTVDMLASQMKAELLSALQPAFAIISSQGIRYSSLPAKTTELTAALQTSLKDLWGKRGIELTNGAIESLVADEEDEKMLKQMQRNVAYTNPSLAQATLVGAQAQAMMDAAKNSAGAINGFMAMNMFSQPQMQQQSQQSQQTQQTQQTTSRTWYCPDCGTKNEGNFCTQCGCKKPQ